ncbi:universal stress protein UspA [Marichromatium purpuratum 984]|uniref:Universal stress protein UspA n=1 Tax=Marichromatium purpuratum 984 TaxID=765910 RepID=W0E0N3_MARPU|nr:universal stress protein [Marichromatium purpuratum]AHF02774.1 universal stress protein UspA [Marichromatium purpuratum 984]
MTKPTAPSPILVPVDFSPHSEAALTFAAELAGCRKRPLLILHVVHDPFSMPGYYGRALKKKQLHRIEDGAAEMFDEFVAAVSARHPDLAPLQGAETLLVKGLPSTRILEIAERRAAQQIVMGSKGLTGLRHLLIGSVAERVVHRATTPVTIVKSPRNSTP